MPRLVEAVQSAGQIVTWVCDPMHGNTESVAGYKTRRYERIRQEVRSGVWRIPSLLMHVYHEEIHYSLHRFASRCTDLGGVLFAPVARPV